MTTKVPVEMTSGFSLPPLNVNPNFLLDQINEGALYTVNTTGVQTVDGWTGQVNAAPGVFKLRRLADPDNAALKCLEITCTTADASITAADNYYIFTAVEGYDAAALMPGTASASQLTIQFKFKSNVTGVYGVSVYNANNNRWYPSFITVPDTSENSYAITLTMDTAGTWDYTNGVGLYVRLTLAAGSNFHGTANAWTGSGTPTTTSSQANFMSANTNVAYLKRLHVIPSGVALAYHPQDIQRELAKAERSYWKTWEQGTAVGTATTTREVRRYAQASSVGTTQVLSVGARVTMRTGPTSQIYSPGTGSTGYMRVNDASDLAASILSATPYEVVGISAAAGAVANDKLTAHFTANARLS